LRDGRGLVRNWWGCAVTSDPSDAETILNALDFDTNWLLEESNKNPLQFFAQAERLYSIMNRIQLVTSRFARVCNDNKDEFDLDLVVMKALRESDQQWKDAGR
jgi:hypothetical protein